MNLSDSILSHKSRRRPAGKRRRATTAAVAWTLSLLACCQSLSSAAPVKSADQEAALSSATAMDVLGQPLAGKVDDSVTSVIPETSQRMLGLKLAVGKSGIFEVISVAADSEAAEAGLQPGDEIISAQQVDSIIEIVFQRKGEKSSLALSDPLSPPDKNFRLERNANGKLTGTKPYSLGAKKTQLMAEQQQNDIRLHRLNPQSDNQKALTGNATQLHGNATQLAGQLNSRQTLPPLAPQRPQLGVGQALIPLQADKFGLDAFNNPPLKGQATSQVRLLADYDVELIVDSSMSMRRRDCPGMLSRWDWCGIQASSLGRQLAPFVPRGLTITTFASLFDVYPNSSPSSIADLFANPNFHGGTKLAEPLANRLQRFLERRRPGSKPLLIAVITDGVPVPMYEPRAVAATLIEASKRMNNANEVTVVFFQIGGNDMYGREFLNYLDHGLMRDGARYDFVRTVSFESLQRTGLAQALVNSVNEFAARHTTAAPASGPPKK